MPRPMRCLLTIDEMARRYESGDTLKTIAAAAGCSSWSVRRLLSDAGVQIRKSWWKNAVPDHPWKDSALPHRQLHDERT
jgi:hypothetical protein